MPGILLCCMPFGQITRPYLGLGLLKASLTRAGMDCEVRYFCLEFACRIGPQLYSSLVDGYRANIGLPGEWLFAPAMYSSQLPELNGYLHRIQNLAPEYYTEQYLEQIQHAQRQVEPFLEHCLGSINWLDYDIVGFTVNIKQLNASLALAERLKRCYPQMRIIFGGQDIFPPMGIAILKTFDFIDYACLGEGDVIFPEFVRRLRAGQALEDLPGLAMRRNRQVYVSDQGMALLPDLDDLPYPDYDDFMDQFQEAFGQRWRDILYFETTRGCRWGEQKHCIFCGVEFQRYRSKTPQRVMDEIVWLADHYNPQLLSATDAQAPSNLGNMLSGLQKRQPRLAFFYNLRATVTKEELAKMKHAGVGFLGIGIESLSTPILRLMRKGTTALTNIQVMKWCRELRIVLGWNLLYGFPSEEPAEYQQMAETIPSLVHLTPPQWFGPFSLLRFSPYFDDPESYGLDNVRPTAAYAEVFPGAPEGERWNLASCFDFDYTDGRNPAEYTESLRQALQVWCETASNSLLAYVDDGDKLRLFDTRPVARQQVQEFTGLERRMYLACDQQQRRQLLIERFADRQPDAIKETLDWFVKEQLMVTEGQTYLSLAVDMGQYIKREKRALASDDFYLALVRGLMCPEPIYEEDQIFR
jgi:ribosomal peptide maturation radical SAM protein 1